MLVSYLRLEMDGSRRKVMQSGWSGAYIIANIVYSYQIPINFVAVLSRKAGKPMHGVDSFDSNFSELICLHSKVAGIQAESKSNTELSTTNPGNPARRSS